MNGRIPLIESGISLVNQTWGGFYQGGTYLVVGPRKSGRTSLGLRYALQGAAQRQVCVYFTTMRPRNLLIQASSIDVDLLGRMNENLVVVVRIAPPAGLHELANPDSYLSEYLNEIMSSVDEYCPSRVVFDELTPYVRFTDTNVLKDTFLRISETLEANDVTSLFVLAEPVNPSARSVADVLMENVTACIYLQKQRAHEGRGLPGGRIILVPNIGHAEGGYCANYTIEPYREMQFELTSDWQLPALPPNGRRKSDSRRLSRGRVEMLPESKSSPNICSCREFLAELNDQVELSKRTNQRFNLIVFRVDSGVEKKRFLTLDQLQNAIRMATEPNDKICFHDSMVMVLLRRAEHENVQGLLSRYVKTVFQQVSGILVRVEAPFDTTDSFIEYIDNNFRQNVGSLQ